MSLQTEHDLWTLALSGQPIDSSALAECLEAQVASGQIAELDFRTKLLIRDSLRALCKSWGEERLESWLVKSPAGKSLVEINRADSGDTGFPSLVHRVMETTKPDLVMQFLRELGLHCPNATRLEVGGSIALILAGVLSRRTEVLDVVDEIPAEIRAQHEMLNELANGFGLHLAHFQSHYLPSSLRERLHPLGQFGGLEVLLVDSGDVFVSKLFSGRSKDRDDLRALAAQLDKSAMAQRLRQYAGELLAEPRLARFAADNWYILYGEPLPN